jgi:ParB-like chromosome segregation protein Spo0J
LKVLLDMGITEVECVVVEMDAEKEKALNVALNKSAATGIKIN